MKKMRSLRNHHHRNILRRSPIQRLLQPYHIINFTMNQQRFFRIRSRRFNTTFMIMINSSSHQQQQIRFTLLCRKQRHIAPKRKACNHQFCQLRMLLPCIINHRHTIHCLPCTIIMFTATIAHTA